ncbi:restriction endonuclease subunit R [Priestia megaterium]|uniref:DEAD/DEAH box helicase family protein n=1 Tax=Priestia megaterium TaxID=1404 RepID=UPI000BF9010D|nr:DEAD/DEAH box helicase family protein [Priestia megaterium]PFE34884.1 restriction endonuclease subunit R [Priestia megaterium]
MVNLLHDRLKSEINLFELINEIPSYIEENLKNSLREYQIAALTYFIKTQSSELSNISFNHLLFRMATGSGKTNVLASCILYLYEQHKYKNFLFYVNSDAVIKKTYENFFNSQSSKYLFKNDFFEINGKRVDFKLVDNFPKEPAANTIYIKLTTVQKLHSELQSPSENTVTLEDMENLKLVMLSDEAHHINAATKSKTNDKSVNSSNSWESTILKLLEINPENRLLEFTATMNFDNKDLLNKYKDKVVFNYDLKEFMGDQYSKNVGLIRNTEPDKDKMLNAVLLSQYRKYISKENNIFLKPVILFKSNSIKISLETHLQFNELIQTLNVENLKTFIKEKLLQTEESNNLLQEMYRYYLNSDLSVIVSDLKFDFKEENLLNANNKEFLSKQNTVLLNTLEDVNNNIRGIFAVAKLNEGWDVLNLFDIVRISEGSTSSKKSTDSEAQLIGRGARYYPFIFNGEKSYKRRFDYVDTRLRAIEKLHYHTINENAYIKNLSKSLEAADINVQEDSFNTFEAKVKKEILKSDFYKNGYIYVNKTVKLSNEEYNSLSAYGIHNEYEFQIEDLVEQELLTGKTVNGNYNKKEIQVIINGKIWRKAILKNSFFHYENLSKFIPCLESINEFIDSKHFLGSINVNLVVPQGLEDKYGLPEQKLFLAESVLEKMQSNIKNNFMKEIGSTLFEPVPVKDVIKDYKINVGKYSKPTFNEIIDSHSMKNKEWYVYENAIVNGLEYSLINYIEGIMEEITSKYGEVYLIRNEKQLKLVEFNGVRGFMPDFILYLKELDTVYQIFIEPKADVLMSQDSWKEEILMSLDNKAKIEHLIDAVDVNIKGVKFFSNTAEYKTVFKNDLKLKLGL